MDSAGHVNRLGDTQVRPPAGRATGFLSDSVQSLSHGERAALEGLLSDRKPTLALAIGVADNAAIERMALHSSEVHTFDVTPPARTTGELANVTFHVGERRELLLEHLDQRASAGLGVDFALLHAGRDVEAVRGDIEALLDSPATSDTLVVICDAMSEPGRAGLLEAQLAAWPKVTHVDLNFVPGRMLREQSTAGELQGGLGLVVTRADHGVIGMGRAEQRYFDAFDVFIRARPTLLRALHNQERLKELTADIGEDDDQFIDPAVERDRLLTEYRALDAEYARLRYVWERTMGSVSWRITKPLRDVKNRVKQFLL
jgi:hypothetical protein